MPALYKGQPVFAVMGSSREAVRRITLAADPPEGGTVSGGGVASDGMTLTVNAQPNEADNYYFDGWKEGETVVGTDPAYTFPVTADKSLVASFLESPYMAGRDWWAATMPSSPNWQSIAYGGGKFVAVAKGSKYTAYSEDGINWTGTTNMPYTYNWYVAYGGGKFVAVSYYKTAYSEDGINWTETNPPLRSVNCYGITYGGGKFVTVGYNSGEAAFSTDGIMWEGTAMPSIGNWQAVTYGNGKFVAVAHNSNKAAYSTDGITWTEATLPSAANWDAVAYGNSKFVAVAVDSNKAVYSTDGINWTEAMLPFSGRWYCVTYGDGKFVSVEYNSNKAAYSTDGITWTEATLPSVANWNAVAYGNGKFVAAAAASNKAAYSSAKGPGA